MPYATELAGNYLNSLTKDPQTVVDLLKPYIKDGQINISDINNTLHTVTDWTGSGRQGSGKFDLSNLYYDQSGNALTQQIVNNFDDNGPHPTYNPISAGSITDLFKQDGGADWYRDPYRFNYGGESSPSTWTPQAGSRTWDQLSEAEQTNLTNNGLFGGMTDPKSQFIVDREGSVGVGELNDLLTGAFQRQYEKLRNTGQEQSESWLQSPQGLMTALSFIPGLQPFMGMAQGVNSVGSGLAHGNYTQAALGAFGLYNGAAGIVNNGSQNYMAGVDQPGSTWYNDMYRQSGIEGIPDFYSRVTPGSIVGNMTNNSMPNWANDALGAGGVAALTGGDPLRYAGSSLVSSGSNALMDYLGIDSNGIIGGIANQGLNYLYTDLYNGYMDAWGPRNNGSQNGGGNSGGTTGEVPGTNPVDSYMPIPNNPYIPPTITTQSSPYQSISGGTSSYGQQASYGTGETYSGDTAQDSGNPYDGSKPERVYA